MEPKEFVSFVVCTALVALSLIGSLAFYHYNQLQAVKSNIESAIVKGIDPLSVRCAYGERNDNICIAYAAGKK